MLKLENMVGKTFSTANYGNIEIINYQNSDNVEIKFVDTGYITTVTMQRLINGSVKDKLSPSVFNVGIVGYRYPITINGRLVLEYNLWRSMLARCYNANFHIKNHSYKGCSVSENFKSYEYFYEWCHRQIGFGKTGWHLDKDLLFKGNKVYSEDTCVFLPSEINGALIHNENSNRSLPTSVVMNTSNNFYSRFSINGFTQYIGTFDTPEEAFLAYKQAKEQYLQHLAYKYEESLDPRAFNALLYYSVDGINP